MTNITIRQIMTNAIIPDELRAYIEQQAEEDGTQIVNISTRGGSSSFIEIVLDKEGGISAGECGGFNRKIMDWLDGNESIKDGYILDVCSPGLDRLLKSEDDYKWALGKKVEIKVHDPVNNKNAIIGKLVNVEDPVIIEDPDGNEVNIDKTNIAKAKLWVSLKR